MVNKYERYLEFCETKRQKEVVGKLAEGNTIKKASKSLGISERSVYATLALIKKKMTAVGKGDHFIADNNLVDSGLSVKGTSTLYKDGEPTIQWVKTDKTVEDKAKALREAVEEIIAGAEGQAKKTKKPKHKLKEDLLNVYISNDLHFGAYMWGEETLDKDYDLDIAETQLDSAISYLVDNSPATKVAIVADLGDTTEGDNFKNSTPTSGHALDVDGRYSKVLKVAMLAMVNLVNKALEKHEIVHFINIGGNHDIVTSHSIRAFVEAWFRNEPRVIVDTSPAPQKYFLHGTTLLGFAHGDGLKMHDAGETMCMHNEYRWSETNNRYYHFGHNHKDKIVDGRLCKAESHRNLAPLNAWASHAGFGRQLGTMKSITYCTRHGEKSRNLFNVAMEASA